MLIRPATGADDGPVGELLVRAFTVRHAQKMPGVTMTDARRAELRAQAERRRHCTVLVAEASGEVIGTVTVYKPGVPGSDAWIAGAAGLRLLAVDPAHHGHGLSAALMDEAESIARGWGVPALCLHTRRNASGLHHLYRARGYLRDPAGDIDRLPVIYLEAYHLPFAPTGS